MSIRSRAVATDPIALPALAAYMATTGCRGGLLSTGRAIGTPACNPGRPDPQAPFYSGLFLFWDSGTVAGLQSIGHQRAMRKGLFVSNVQLAATNTLARGGDKEPHKGIQRA
jgi:hypothetical protein